MRFPRSQLRHPAGMTGGIGCLFRNCVQGVLQMLLFAAEDISHEAVGIESEKIVYDEVGIRGYILPAVCRSQSDDMAA